MRFGAWDVRSLNGAASLPTAARELWRYKLDLVGVQEVKWDRGGTVRAGDCNVFYGKETEIINLEQDVLYTTDWNAI